jgi:exodeoxyribonuclease V alpha subunit
VSTSGTIPTVDRFDASRAERATGLLGEFNAVGLLAPADVHVAVRIAELVGEKSEPVRLAAGFAVRGPRLGHVFVDLATIRDTASIESDEPVDLSTLRWPAPAEWIDALLASELVAVGEEDLRADRPLRLLGTRLYLDRYWREERRVAAGLQELSGGDSSDVHMDLLAEGLQRLFAGDTDRRQRLAAAAAVLGRFAVVAGGPGTGKTTTVARIVALHAEQAGPHGSRRPLFALAAPTGKAAARLQEAVHAEAAQLPVSEEIRGLLLELRASTLHRLLGWRPGSHSRFAHDRENRLPHDVVIVDETSMVSLSLMARLVEAVRPDARLILVGDPGQLSSIEAGVVLGDIVGPASETLRMSAPARARLAQATRADVPAEDPPSGTTIGDGIVLLDRVRRYGIGIARLAEAIRRGDADGTVAALTGASDEITWLPVDVEQSGGDADLHLVRARVAVAGRAVLDAARTGAAIDALDALAQFRLLCAHRRGPHGVSAWTSRVEGWLADEVEDLDLDQPDYVGRPLLITENDYELGLYNGDTGVVVQSSTEHASAVFERGGELLSFSPLRLGAVETVYAMTIHKSQGSQFGTAAILLPPAASRLLTRELMYTAVTRAREELILVGTEDTIRAAVGRPVSRASGLRLRLWGESAENDTASSAAGGPAG